MTITNEETPSAHLFTANTHPPINPTQSFGSMVVQCYWALVNASVDVTFAKKNFGLIVAGAQIGSILGPTLATQAGVIGVDKNVHYHVS